MALSQAQQQAEEADASIQLLQVPRAAAAQSFASSSTLAANASRSGDGGNQKVPQLPRSQNYREWWLELSAGVLSVALLITLIIFLMKLDNSDLTQWHIAWQLAPSTVVSILVTSCRIPLAFMIAEGLGQLKWVFFEQGPQRLSAFEDFDEATRGPWGALCFLYRSRGRALVASLGAALAILVLALEPFSQQVLSYDSRDRELSGNISTMAAAQVYNSGAKVASIPNVQGVPSSMGQSSGPASFGGGLARGLKRAEYKDREDRSECADTLMARAAYGGLFSTDISTDFTCLSGNCTWPAFTTLSICGACTDITDATKIDCDHNKNGSDCQYKLPDQGPPVYVSGDLMFPHAFKSQCWKTSSGLTPGEYTTVLNGPRWRTEVINNISPKDSHNLVSFNTFSFHTDYLKMYDCKLPKATIRNCSLSWCATMYETVVVRNNQLIEAKSTFKNLVTFESSNDGSCDSLQDASPPSSNENISWQGLIDPSQKCPATPPGRNSNLTFWINKFDHEMTQKLLWAIVAQKEITTDGLGSAYAGFGAGGGASDVALLTALFDKNGGDIAATVSDIATSMTNRIRASAEARAVLGTTLRTRTIIKVNWYWLIYLCVMVVLGFVFFVTAMCFSSEKSRVIWKSSSLALLFHGLQGVDHVHQSDHCSISDMYKRAKNFEARLQVNEEGALRLVRQ